MNIVIRKFQKRDAKDVSEVGKMSWFHTYSHIFDQEYINQQTSILYNPKNLQKIVEMGDYTQMYVAVSEGTIVGFCQPSLYNYWDPATFNPNVMIISRLYIHPKFMRQGIGSQLLQRSEKWMKEKGFKHYTLFVHKDNPIGYSFYLKHGFILAQAANDDNEILLKKTIN